MVAGMSSSLADSAMAWAWLPEEKVSYAGAALRGVELRQRIEGAAKLEGAHALEVLALEEQLRAEQPVRRRGPQHRRAVGRALQAGGRRQDVLVGGELEHWAQA